MVYNPSIPMAADYLSDSQPAILENFSQLNTLFAINHIAFDDVTAADRGKHTFVTMLENTGSPLTDLGEGAIYVDVIGATTRQYAYYKREDGAAGAGIEIPFSMLAGFGKLVGAGFGGTPFNLDTCAYPAVGRYNVVFTDPMVDENYAVVATAQTNAGFKFICSILTQTAAGFTVQVFDDGGNFAAPTSVNVIVYGEIA